MKAGVVAALALAAFVVLALAIIGSAVVWAHLRYLWLRRKQRKAERR